MSTSHPTVRRIWDAGLAAYKVAHPEHVDALAHVVDLAMAEFYELAEGAETHPAFEAEGPVAVEVVLGIWAAKWLGGVLRQIRRVDAARAEGSRAA